LRDAIEPDLQLIEPGGVGWSAVHVEPWPCDEPASNSRMFVRGIVIHDDVHWHSTRSSWRDAPGRQEENVMAKPSSCSRGSESNRMRIFPSWTHARASPKWDNAPVSSFTTTPSQSRLFSKLGPRLDWLVRGQMRRALRVGSVPGCACLAPYCREEI
jgi:hypothetical protein